MLLHICCSFFKYVLCCKTESQKFTSIGLQNSSWCQPIQGGSDDISISDVHPEWEKIYPTSTLMTTAQLQQGNHASVHIPQHEMEEGTQVFDENFSKSQYIVSLFHWKGQVYCPPCLDSLLLQGSRVFYSFFWYQFTFPPKFALFHCIYMTTLFPVCCLASLLNFPYLTIDDLNNHYLFQLPLLVTSSLFFWVLLYRQNCSILHGTF